MSCIPARSERVLGRAPALVTDLPCAHALHTASVELPNSKYVQSVNLLTDVMLV